MGLCVQDSAGGGGEGGGRLQLLPSYTEAEGIPSLLAWLISDFLRLNLCALRTGSVWWDGKGWGEAPTVSLAACRFLFMKIMAVLTELRSINAQQTQQLLRIQDTHPFVTPLMQELFSSTDG